MNLEHCSLCGKVIALDSEGNGPYRFTRKDEPEVFCTRQCRASFFEAPLWQPGRCTECGAKLENRNKNTQFCGNACRVRFNRAKKGEHTHRKQRTYRSENGLSSVTL